jgi:hypothetical protein
MKKEKTMKETENGRGGLRRRKIRKGKSEGNKESRPATIK